MKRVIIIVLAIALNWTFAKAQGANEYLASVVLHVNALNVTMLSDTIEQGQQGQEQRVQEQHIPVASVNLSQTRLTLRVGAIQKITANVLPQDATNKRVRWVSDAPNIATISDGEVRGVAVGEAIITVFTEDGNKEATCTVTVTAAQPAGDQEPQPDAQRQTPVRVTGVTLSPTELSLSVNDSRRITATPQPTNANNKNVRWESSDVSVATVNDGTVRAIAEGTARITVISLDNNRITATCTVTVGAIDVAVTRITLDNEKLTLREGGGATLTATVLPDNASDKVVWESSDHNVAIVEEGEVTAIAEGTATITVTANGISAECVITVEPEPVTEIIRGDGFQWQKYIVPILLGAVSLLLLIALILIFVIKTREIAVLRREVESKDAEIEKNASEFAALKTDKDDLSKRMQELSAQIEVLNSEIERLRKQALTISEKPKIRTEHQPAQPPLQPKLYADAINEKEFFNVSNRQGDLAVYELEVSGNSANFTICASAEKRVIARPGSLDGCEKDIVQGGRSLRIVETGKAREAGGKWVVVTPLKIRIE